MTTPTGRTDRTLQPQEPHRGKRSAFARVPSAVRLQFSPAVTLIGVPLLVFFAAWLIAVGIGWWIHTMQGSGDSSGEPMFTGAAQAPLWALVFVAAYSASHTFPFSMALSYSRRTFMLGVILAFGLVSVAFGAAFILAAWIERVTDGFGMHVYTFDLPYLTQGSGGIVAAGGLAATLCLVLMMVGFFWAILYLRAGLFTLWVIILGLAVVGLAGTMLIFQNDGWPVIWEWIMQQSALSLTGWLAILAVGLAGLNYGVIRRATPA